MNDKRYGRLVFVVLVIVVISGCGSDGHYYPPPETEGGWRVVSGPEQVRSLGLDPEKLEEFGRYNLSIKSSSGVKGCIVIKDGWVVGEWYEGEGAETFQNYISSNGKAWGMLLYGILMEEAEKGNLPFSLGLGSKLYDKRWLAEGFPLSDPRKAEITFEQLFKHRSGILPESAGDTRWGPDWDFRSYTVGHDPDYPKSAKLLFDPGTDYDYSSVSFNHLSLVFRNITGVKSSEYLWQKMLEPIGFGEVSYWDHEGMGDYDWAPSGQTGPKMTTRDYARLAYLLLRSGRWADEQIFTADYLEIFTSSPDYPNIRSNIDSYFGDQYPKDLFRTGGSGLNWAYVVPSLDLVAVRTSRASNALWDEVKINFLQKLFAALGE
ncbi:serine hydrolase domain-containing protein [candidate division KSB1 bacterium]